MIRNENDMPIFEYVPCKERKLNKIKWMFRIKNFIYFNSTHNSDLYYIVEDRKMKIPNELKKEGRKMKKILFKKLT